jgi:imidazolonepropionase-like amidohydrolase
MSGIQLYNYMRTTLVGILLISCAPRRAASPKAPELDVAQPWTDPELDSPTSTSHRSTDLHDATVNRDAGTTIIQHATIVTATGQSFAPGSLVMSHGEITYVGTDAGAPAIAEKALLIDGNGMFVTPGIIDAHSHIGVYSAPAGRGTVDGNEMTSPVTAGARAEYGFAPNDPQINRALAGGVTTALILPGSANLVGGRGFTVAMQPARTTEEAAFPGAPSTVKMACGENPKRVYGEKGGPATRMGEYAAFRTAFIEAAEYQRKINSYSRERVQWINRRDRAATLNAQWQRTHPGAIAIKGESGPTLPVRDLKLETLAGVLRGDVLVQIHCYKASDIAQMIAIADEFGFKIRSFHHALEAYKIRDILVQKNIAINTWADWWGFKFEAFDGIPENAALFTEQGGRATIHSDSAIGIQRLNQEAAKALASGRAAGIKLTDDDALRWITANPAWVLGIDSVTGTLETGKRADVTVWSGPPLSVYSLPTRVFIAGALAYDSTKSQPLTDFELGNSAHDRSANDKVTP